MRIKFQQVFIFHFFLIFSFQSGLAQKGKITGTVYNTEGVLAGATISVGSIYVISNRIGNFSISLNPGKYSLSITHVGYINSNQEVTVTANNISLVNIAMIPDEKMGEPVVLGSRVATSHSDLLSPVPVDVISSRQLLQTAQTGLTQMLQFTVPALNASRQLVNEPLTLRGLEPDQLLILVDGKRYHNLAFLNFGGVRGILGRGAVSNDLNSIPFSGIDKIEILKDGASSQYGSDAISGVINIQLKKSIDKLWIQLHTGQFYKADGKTITVESNYGVALNKKGFLNFSTSYRFQDPTYRGGTYMGTVYTNNVVADDSIIRARNFDRNKPSNAGTSKQNGFNFLINGSYEIGKQKDLFWVAGMNHRTTIFTSTYIFPKNLRAINSDLFPDGFKARPSNHSNDIWGIIGIRGTANNWQWEYGSTWGTNFANYYNKETNNPSQFYLLGKNAPTKFYTGSLVYGQFVHSIQASKKLFAHTNQSLNLGFGAEWRSEYFQIKRGEEASWNNYDPRKNGGSGGLVFAPTDQIKASRNVGACYLDIESEYDKRFLVDLSTRYEYYNDFGNNLAGKIALRYTINTIFSIRSSISNGFRAPSLQQKHYSFTRLGIPSSSGEIPIWGIFRNNSAVANALGISSLEAERSINISGGFVANFEKHISVALDAYWIRIKDRIVLSGAFDRAKNSNVDNLLFGITNVDQVQFFTNAINTKTKGVDIIINGRWKLNNASLLTGLASNITQTKVFGSVKTAGNLKADSLNSNTLFDRAERGRLEKGQPNSKLILSFIYKINKIEFVLRNTRFGTTSLLVTDPSTDYDEFFSAKILTDLNINYSLKKWITITAGANNMFNIFPGRLKNYKNTIEGQLIYSQEASPFGFNGGYYFLSILIKK
jgi:iron complex outermembrane receptor protein